MYGVKNCDAKNASATRLYRMHALHSCVAESLEMPSNGNSLLTDLAISRVRTALSETHSDLEIITTFDQHTDVPGDTIPELSSIEIIFTGQVRT